MGCDLCGASVGCGDGAVGWTVIFGIWVMGCDLCGASVEVEGGDGAVGWTVIFGIWVMGCDLSVGASVGWAGMGRLVGLGVTIRGGTQVRQRQELWRTWSIRIASRVKDGCGLYCYQASWDTELLASTVKL